MIVEFKIIIFIVDNLSVRLCSYSIVASSSPAYEAGILPGDILIGVDNSPITGRPLTYSLANELIEHRSRNTIELQILRDPKNRVRKL
ncbi:hypothetical protein BLA29_013592, partial [Euroglyphus maynei]